MLTIDNKIKAHTILYVRDRDRDDDILADSIFKICRSWKITKTPLSNTFR